MELTVFKHDQQYVVDSRQIAEMTGKLHKNLIRDIENYIQIMESSNLSYGLTEPVSSFFIKSSYSVDGSDRQYKCYLCTKMGCEMIANKMTGEKGILFTAVYVSKFNQMEKSSEKEAALIAATASSQRALAISQNIENRMTGLEKFVKRVADSITLTSNEQRLIQRAIVKRVKLLLDTDYRRYRAQYFAWIYRELKDRYGLGSYRDLPRVNFEEAMTWISVWRPSMVA